ncbi:hypothetical protein M422DRAFT_248395 [Sphaerobolus stellatus SS14]|uniref:Uncharacterized protein n=1 Tax=Sphaerobolus stellatus (strain SS14) TaxID=990650 RepID=A0A0C9W5T5_SPHS4|nr:hypothetical protein M422DRAFT_248395 [Sphaerobolus stellatus SS14]
MLLIQSNDPSWMADIVRNYNKNHSGVPHNLHTEGVFVNVDDADIWYWVKNTLQTIFSTTGKWSQIVAGHWKRNDSMFLCEPKPASEEGFFSQTPVNVADLRNHISYSDSLVPRGDECKLTDELTHDLYMDNLK